MRIKITATRSVIVEVPDAILAGWDPDDDHPFRAIEAVDKWAKELDTSCDQPLDPTITWAVED